MRATLSTSDIHDYKRFLAIKQLPQYSFRGRTAIFPDEYAGAVMGIHAKTRRTLAYDPHPGMFDYQRDITGLAVEKGKFAMFEDCGLGKTLQMLDFARHAARAMDAPKCVLIVSPIMVVSQTIGEAEHFYGGDLQIARVSAANLQEWLTHGTDRIGITNYEAIKPELTAGRLGSLILDESSMLKSHYGKSGQTLLRLGRGLDWKLAGTGTPAPNDRIEYANHAVFMDAFPNVNAFLARFFVNRGQTQNRWELKAHAIEPFYRALSHWSIFLVNPGAYGWEDMTTPLPPINVHIHDVSLTQPQIDMLHKTTGMLLAGNAGGIASRGAMGQIAKGHYRGTKLTTNKPAYIRKLIESWPDESTLLWCLYNAEQERIENELPDAASISGDTPLDVRIEMIRRFKAGEVKVLISKPKIMGFGLNLQIATRQVFSGLQDSYETYYQAVKRSNRYGATKPLNVHIPITDAERPMIETVLEKAKMVQRDTEQQQRIFMENRYDIA